MTVQVTIDLEGVEESIKVLRETPGKHREAIKKAFRTAGQLLRTDIVANRLSNPRQPMRKGRRVRVPGTKNAWRGLAGPVRYPQVLGVLTGRLRNSIYEVWSEGFVGNDWHFQERIGTNVFYARFHEFGRNRVRAFMLPAVEDNWPQIRRLIEAAGFGDVGKPAINRFGGL